MARHRNRSVFSQGSSTGVGRRLVRLLLILVLLVFVGGLAFLGFGDLQPPATTVEKVVPDARLSD